MNIEQSRKINLTDIAQFIGELEPSINAQRSELHRLSGMERTIGIYKANNEFLKDGPNRSDIFYYDPTSKEYTGMHKNMKSWCGTIHGISKVMYLDAIHTRQVSFCVCS